MHRYNSHLVKAVLSVLALSLLVAGSATAETVFVQVRNSRMRAGPNPWSTSIAVLAYGDSLSIVSDENKSWWQVKNPKGQVGYVAASSVTTRQVVLTSNGAVANGSVDASDVVMAGKGFSKEVEASYANSSDLDYSGVNHMESLKISDSDLSKFAKEGQLRSGN